MKGSMRPRVMSRPCARPKTAPSTSAKAIPSITTPTVESPDVPRLFIKRMTHPAISAAIDPTERSMPPEMITKHMPTAMMPIKAVRVSTFMPLSKVAKSRLSSVPATHSSARPAIGPIPCRRAHHDRPAVAPAVPRAGVSGGCCCGRGLRGFRLHSVFLLHAQSMPLRSGVRHRAWLPGGPPASRLLGRTSRSVQSARTR